MPPGVATALAHHEPHIDTLSALWDAIAGDFDKNLPRLAQATGVSREVLLALLAMDCLDDNHTGYFQEGLSLSRARTLLAKLSLALTLVLIGVALIALVWEALPKSTVLSRQVVVQDPKGLMPLQLIGPAQIGYQYTFIKSSESFSDLNDAIDHYALATLPAGTVLQRDQVLSVQSKELVDNYLVSVPIKAGAVAEVIKPESRVSLLFSVRQPTDKLQSFTVNDLLLLNVNHVGGSTSVTVALPKSDLERVQSALSISDVFVTVSYRRPTG